jgi:hypothetical protein
MFDSQGGEEGQVIIKEEEDEEDTPVLRQADK